jgi:hypothetical protein
MMIESYMEIMLGKVCLREYERKEGSPIKNRS